MKKPQTLAAKLSENRGQERGCLVLDQPQHLAKAWLSGIFHALRLVFDAAALRPLPVASASLLLLCPTSAHAQGGVPLWTNVYRGPSWGVAVLASIAVDRAENVFVTDGAFMTSARCQNPSLGYMAFTARAADHAVSELKKMNL